MAPKRNTSAGVGLAEALVATAVFMTIAVGVAPLLVFAGASIAYARDQTMTTALAAAKLQELEGLDWGFRFAAGGTLEPVQDALTNLALVPPGSSGPGLTPSPVAALLASTPGYVDFLDGRGRWVGTGSSPPAGSRYVRRWSIARWSNDPDGTLLLRVVAATVTADAVGPRSDSRPRRGDTWLFSVKTRVRP